MIQCFGFLVFFQCEVPKPAVVDSYCTSYERVIRQPSESAISAPLSVKQRIATNDIVYRCKCKGWKSPLCAPR
jgi:hypothetical protein